MEKGSRRVRRAGGQIPSPAGPPTAKPAPITSPANPAPAVRAPRAKQFAEHLEATTSRMRFTAEDESYVAWSRELLRTQIDGVVEEVYLELLTDRDAAIPFVGADPGATLGQGCVARGTFHQWLQACVDAPPGPASADYLTSIGHDLVRPRDPDQRPIKARYPLIAMGRMQSLLVGVLAKAIDDPEELAAHAAAWSKYLTIELDLLLAIYGSTGATARWY